MHNISQDQMYQILRRAPPKTENKSNNKHDLDSFFTHLSWGGFPLTLQLNDEFQPSG